MSGRPYYLIETERIIEGRTYHPIADIDVYRTLIDMAQIALEDRNLLAFEKMRPRIESAAFCMCPACLDRFDKREGCLICDGNGFTLKLPQKDLHG